MLGLLGKLGRRSASTGARSVSGVIRPASTLTGGNVQARGGRVINNAVDAAAGRAPRVSRMPGEYTPVASQILRGKPGMGGSVPVEATAQSAMDARMAQAVAARRAQMAQTARQNVAASARARKGSGYRASGVGMSQAQRTRATMESNIRRNIGQSRNARTGGYRGSGVGRSPGPMQGAPGPGPMYGPPKPKPGPVYGPPRPASSGNGATSGRAIRSMSQRYKDMSPKTRRMLMAGGAAAVGVTAASNRRGQGTSSGRQSMTRY